MKGTNVEDGFKVSQCSQNCNAGCFGFDDGDHHAERNKYGLRRNRFKVVCECSQNCNVKCFGFS